MKKILIVLALLAFGINAKAQITLEHVYDTASTDDNNQLMIMNFETSGQHYVRINILAKTINIYDLNHSLTKSMSFASFPINPNNIPIILFLSENLFDNDPDIDFMWIYTTNLDIDHTHIYNEDGSLIFQADSMSPLVTMRVPQQQFPIYNTSNGTKMILSCIRNSYQQAKVFSLPGTLSAGIAEANNYLIEMQTQSSVSNAFPNPTNNRTQIDYVLTDGINEGEIVFYNLHGTEIKRFKVDKSFNTLLVSTSDIAAGTYLYQLQTKGQKSEGKKLIVIK